MIIDTKRLDELKLKNIDEVKKAVDNLGYMQYVLWKNSMITNTNDALNELEIDISNFSDRILSDIRYYYYDRITTDKYDILFFTAETSSKLTAVFIQDVLSRIKIINKFAYNTFHYHQITALGSLIKFIDVKTAKKRIEDAVEYFIKDASSIFGEGNYAYTVTDTYPYTADFYIKFPKVIITNSKKHFKIIRDLLVKIRVVSNDKCAAVGSVNGTRVTFNSSDIINNYLYLHSHLSVSNSHGSYNAFCLGDSAITQLWGNLCREFKPVVLTSFLYHLCDYVSYESLEGGPYVNIKQALSHRETGSNNSINTNAVANALIARGLDIMECITKIVYVASNLQITFDEQYDIKGVVNKLCFDYMPTTTQLMSKKFKSPVKLFEDKYDVEGLSAKFGDIQLPLSFLPVEEEDIEFEKAWLKIEENNAISDQVYIDIYNQLKNKIRTQITNVLKLYSDDYYNSDFCQKRSISSKINWDTYFGVIN